MSEISAVGCEGRRIAASQGQSGLPREITVCPELLRNGLQLSSFRFEPVSLKYIAR